MSPRLSEDDVGKRVEDGSGMAIGYVVAVEDGTPFVETEPDLSDSIRAALGWSGDESEAVHLREDAVVGVTDDAVRLRTERGDADAAHDDVERDEGDSWRTVGSSADLAGAPVETDSAASDEGATTGQPSRETAGADAGGDDTAQLHTDLREDSGADDGARGAGFGTGSDEENGDAHGTDLDLARAELKRASDAADAPVQEHLNSLKAGIFEERSEGGDEPVPKDDRIEELADKLDGLAAETGGEVGERIRRSRDLLRDYLADR